MITWPTKNTSFIDWRDTLVLTRPDIDINPRVNSEDEWREWAGRLIQSAVCQTANSPRPEGFKDWRSWADAFIKSFGANP